MNGPYYVELLARNGDVWQRQRVDALPIRLGRGYDNDVILDDDYVAAAHAVLDVDAAGRLVLHDLGTTNGLAVDGRRQREAVLSGETVVRLGHTSLRVRAAGFPVPAELPDHTFHGWEGALPGMVGVILVALATLLLRWLTDTQYPEYVRYGEALAEGIAGALLWAGAWALATRLFSRYARLGRHLFVFGCGLVALLASALLAATLGYAFSREVFTRYFSSVAVVLVAGTVYFHLCTIKPQHRLRYRWTSLGLALLGSGLILTTNVQRTGRFADELYMAVLLPPELRASRDHGIDEFMRSVEAMQPGLDRGRGRRPGDDAGGK